MMGCGQVADEVGIENAVVGGEGGEGGGLWRRRPVPAEMASPEDEGYGGAAEVEARVTGRNGLPAYCYGRGVEHPGSSV